jgi:hypothetical protein
MALPHNLHKKYLDRFDELIREGEIISEAMVLAPSEDVPESYTCNKADFKKLNQWKISCIALLENIIPAKSAHRGIIAQIKRLEPESKYLLEKYISSLKAIKENFEQGFLGDLALQIEAEIIADYMGQAEQLLAEGRSGQYDHVPAAVLAGAVLEKGLRTLFTKQTPSLPLINAMGHPLMMNRLIDELKKAGAFTELKAKQLRAWADIRNKAAHGEFSEFNRRDVETMIGSINNFLADYLS